MYQSVKNIKAIRSYVEALEIHTGYPTVHFKDKTRCTYVVESKTVTPRVKYIENIPVFFLKEKYDNGLFIPKYGKYFIMPSDMCTKPCPVTIISRSTQLITCF